MHTHDCHMADPSHDAVAVCCSSPRSILITCVLGGRRVHCQCSEARSTRHHLCYDMEDAWALKRLHWCMKDSDPARITHPACTSHDMKHAVLHAHTNTCTTSPPGASTRSVRLRSRSATSLRWESRRGAVNAGREAPQRRQGMAVGADRAGDGGARNCRWFWRTRGRGRRHWHAPQGKHLAPKPRSESFAPRLWLLVIRGYGSSNGCWSLRWLT